MPHQGFPGGSAVKNQPAMQEPQEMWVWSLGGEDALEEGIATHSSILVWRMPWTEEPGGLQSIAAQRVRHDWSDWVCTHTRGTCWKLTLWNSPEIHPWVCWGELLTRKCLTRGTLQQSHLRGFPGAAAGHYVLLAAVYWKSLVLSSSAYCRRHVLWKLSML